MMDDALKSMTRRQLEELQERIERELRSCLLCAADGATPYRVSSRGMTASLLICKPCFEKHRLPESRAISPTEGVEDPVGEGTLAV